MMQMSENPTECSTREEDCVCEYLECYHRDATNERLTISCRLAAANAYINRGGYVDIHTEKDNVLLHVALSKLPFREIMEWFTRTDEILDRNIYGTIAKRLAEAVHKSGEEADSENKRMLQRCVKLCFRGTFLQRSDAMGLKILKTVLKLQRELDVTAVQQFTWLCLLPSALKEKWTLLASVIATLKRNEIHGNVESMLISTLWKAQAYHSSGSVTSDCLRAWFSNDGSDHATCARFLANCLMSSSRMRRLNSSRFWLAKLNTNAQCILIMQETAVLILQMISEEKQLFKESCRTYCLTEEELRELTCEDYFWNPEEEEDGDDVVWWRLDRLLFAWVSVQKFFIRALKTNEIGLLYNCLTSYHSSLRLEAFRLSKKLMDKKLFNWSRHFGSAKFFVLQNLATSNGHLRAELIDFVHTSDTKTCKRLETALLDELDDIRSGQTRSYQILFILELLEQCGFDRWLSKMPQIDSLFYSSNPEIRTKLLVCLSPAQTDSRIFLVNKFMEALNSDSTDDLSSLVHILSQFKSPQEIFNLTNACKCKNFNTIKVLMTSLMQNSDREVVLDPLVWTDACINSNLNLVSLSGSERCGECTSLPELYERLYPSLSYPMLMINDEQRKAVDQYYHTLKINCEMLTYLCETMASTNITDAYDSVWNVLMRSRHKGVVDDCAVCFYRITACCMANGLREIVHDYLKKTKKLFKDSDCTTRNLAFCLVFKTFHGALGEDGSVIEFLLESVFPYMPRKAVRVMKVLKTFLCSANFDVTINFSGIFELVLNLYRKGDGVVRSSACHCFAALVHKLVDDTQAGMPLFMFITRYGSLWDECCKQLELTTVHDPAFILLLSLLEKLRLVSASLYTKKQLKYLELLVRKFVSLLIVSPNLRINRLLLSSLLHLVPCRRKLLVRLNKMLEQKMPSNMRIALNYAVLELEALDYLEPPSNQAHSSCSYDVSFLPNLVQKTYKMLFESHFVSFDDIRDLLVEIEKYVYSRNESRRLHAAHALVMFSRDPWCNVLNDSSSYRCRFVACCRSLLMDEVACIRRVVSRLDSACHNGTLDKSLFYACNPAIKLRDFRWN